MSTRGIIARTTGPEGQFAGCYHHSDSYPTGLGAELWKLYHGHFQRDLKKMLRFLLDKHTGWSCIVDKDFSLKPGYTWQKATEKAHGFENYSNLPDYQRPQCHCHGTRREKGHLFTEKDLPNTDCEWLYAFDEEQNKLFVRDIGAKEDVVVVDLAGPEPDWVAVECGENFERCGHYAWYHGLTPKTSNLSTQTWLGKRSLEFRDAIAFIIEGKRYKVTGCGRNSNYFNSHGRKFPRDTWVATVQAKNGQRVDIAVAKITGSGYLPFDGVTWVYPPTNDNPIETLVSA